MSAVLAIVELYLVWVRYHYWDPSNIHTSFAEAEDTKFFFVVHNPFDLV